MLSLGQVVATPGALNACDFSNLMLCLTRHRAGDWGDLGAEDKQANTRALVEGTRVFSAYMVNETKIWIITEADRSVTTVLLLDEY